MRSRQNTGSVARIVCIRPTGARNPLYIASGLGGNVVRFYDLAQNLSPDLPVYALQPPGLVAGERFLTSIEEMAASYVSEIRRLQPAGPYCLAGYSFGGLVVFEMAHQLQRLGQEIGLLAMLDCPALHYSMRRDRVTSLRGYLQRYKARTRELLFGPARLEYLKKRSRRRLSALVFRFCNLAGFSLPAWAGTMEDVNAYISSAYRPNPYSGDLTLLKTRLGEDSVYGDDHDLGWGCLVTGRVEVHEVPGNHDDMTARPNVIALAEKLSACLDATAFPQRIGQAPAGKVQAPHFARPITHAGA